MTVGAPALRMAYDTQIQENLQDIVRHLVDAYHPLQIVLYGSFAWGTPHADSDIDLLIVKDTEESPLQRRVHVRRLVAQARRQAPFSPLVLTPAELEQRLALNDPFYKEILEHGILLYARH